jgi:hypothetical protein
VSLDRSLATFIAISRRKPSTNQHRLIYNSVACCLIRQPHNLADRGEVTAATTFNRKETALNYALADRPSQNAIKPFGDGGNCAGAHGPP